MDVTDEMNGTGFTSNGSVTTTGELEVADIASGTILFDNEFATFAGTLDLEDGIPSGTLVKFETPLTSDAVVNLNDAGVAGGLRTVTNSAADVMNGGPVTGVARSSDTTPARLGSPALRRVALLERSYSPTWKAQLRWSVTCSARYQSAET